MKKIKVKGKAEPQQIYAVLGRLDDPGLSRTPGRSATMVGWETGPIAKADAEEHEEKFKILD